MNLPYIRRVFFVAASFRCVSIFMPPGWWRVLDYERDPEAEVTIGERLATRNGVGWNSEVEFFKFLV